MESFQFKNILIIKIIVSVFQTGLVIHPLAQFLGTSNISGVLEIKCPSYKNLEDALQKPAFCLQKDENNSIRLKQKHKYFYQVQGQMLLCGVEFCDFVVYFSKSEEYYMC